jgi:hypothetical protein
MTCVKMMKYKSLRFKDFPHPWRAPGTAICCRAVSVGLGKLWKKTFDGAWGVGKLRRLMMMMLMVSKICWMSWIWTLTGSFTCSCSRALVHLTYSYSYPN